MNIYGILLRKHDISSVRVYKYKLSKLDGVFVFNLTTLATEFSKGTQYPGFLSTIVKKSQLTSFVAEDGIYLYLEYDDSRKTLIRLRLDKCRYCCVLLDGFVKDLTYDINWITQSKIS